MGFDIPTQSIFWSAVFSLVVLVIFLFEYRRVRNALLDREEQMKRRMYELSILRELGDRIGYSLNVQKIVDIISRSLGDLLPYSTVAYVLPDEEGRLLFNIILAESVNKPFISEVKKRLLKSVSALFGKQYDEEQVDESVTGVVTDPASKVEIRSFFNVPIVINDKPAAILNVSSAKAGLYKTNEEVEILYTIVNQASEAVSKLQTVLEIEKGKLNSMVASMADGVLMIDTHSRLLVVNPATREMLGIKNHSGKDITIFDIFDAVSDRLDLRTKIEESQKKDELVVVEQTNLNDRFLQILITPVKDKKGELLGNVVLFHDITREKELEKMREDFTSMMVHELRSPLTGIRSIADLLKTEKIRQEPKKYSEFVELISSNSSSMLDLVNDLLDVAKLESGKFQIFKAPADLKKVIDQRVESFRGLAEQNKLTIEENIPSPLPPALPFDENKIAQVLNNLISNSIKFTPAGGRIILSAFACPAGKDLTQQAAASKLMWPGMVKGAVCEKDSVVIGVSDTGSGISQSEMGRLFNKFEQLESSARSEKKGTGLGLVIVKGVVEAHSGKVGIFSEVGKGTTFYFTIPVKDDSPPKGA